MSVTAVAGGPGLPGDTVSELDADLTGPPAYRVRFPCEPLDALDSALPALPPAPATSPSPAGPGSGHQGGHGPGHGPAGPQYSITGLLQSLGAADCGLASLGGLGGLGGLGSMVQSEEPSVQHGQQHLAFSKLGERCGSARVDLGGRRTASASPACRPAPWRPTAPGWRQQAVGLPSGPTWDVPPTPGPPSRRSRLSAL